jgi:hypothetical protein
MRGFFLPPPSRTRARQFLDAASGSTSGERHQVVDAGAGSSARLISALVPQRC